MHLEIVDEFDALKIDHFDNDTYNNMKKISLYEQEVMMN